MKTYTFAEVAKSLEGFLKQNPNYKIQDISAEAVREIILPRYNVMIKDPIALVTRVKGTTHRVIDATGVSYCYASPEEGFSVVAWVLKNPDEFLNF